MLAEHKFLRRWLLKLDPRCLRLGLRGQPAAAIHRRSQRQEHDTYRMPALGEVRAIQRGLLHAVYCRYVHEAVIISLPGQRLTLWTVLLQILSTLSLFIFTRFILDPVIYNAFNAAGLTATQVRPRALLRSRFALRGVRRNAVLALELAVVQKSNPAMLSVLQEAADQ